MSEVDICNDALAYLGDTATVSSLVPPEGSAQAELCARFYPRARNICLEAHQWNFATRRAALALLTATNDQWLYVYAVPNYLLNVIAIIPPDVTDDYNSVSLEEDVETAMFSMASAQPYAIETTSTGAIVICTNQVDAVCRYTQTVTDTTKYPQFFQLAISWLLASMLAGPIIKGDVGAAEAKRCLQLHAAYLSRAMVLDTNQRKANINHTVPWTADR